MSPPRRTPLYQAHRRLSARMFEFAGYELPVQYTSIRAEHQAVRERAGVFDVSHMGQIHLTGPGAVETAERLLTRPVASLAPGRVRYGLLCNQAGGIVDDVTFYRLDDQALMLCVNAANREKDHHWIRDHAEGAAEVEDRSESMGLLAVQGPASPTVLARAGAPDTGTLRRYGFGHLEVAGRPALVSRTGYTGETGFEIYLDAADLEPVFEGLLEAGRPLGLVPAGLGARDTLRLEAALPLYGHELDETTSPLEAGLGRFVKLDEGGFIGADAIRSRRDAGHSRVLVGFELEGRGVARAGHPIARDGEILGAVTSGAPSPTLGKSIGLAYVPPQLARPGARFEVVIRGRPIPARAVETPFVRRGSAG